MLQNPSNPVSFVPYPDRVAKMQPDTKGPEGIGFAVPINMARRVMDEIVQHGQVRRGWIGLSLQDLTPELASPLHHPRLLFAPVGTSKAGGDVLPTRGTGLRPLREFILAVSAAEFRHHIGNRSCRLSSKGRKRRRATARIHKHRRSARSPAASGRHQLGLIFY